MPRSTLEQEVEIGILSVNNAATLLGCSGVTVKKLCITKKINATNISDNKKRKEFKVTAVELLKYCKKKGLPIHKKLIEAVKNYRNNFV